MAWVTIILRIGLATTSLFVAGVGFGVAFGVLILSVARNPYLRCLLFAYAKLGFAFSEATGLFILMMIFPVFFFISFSLNQQNKLQLN
jgi:F-type H+-transporting ATPase subunit c